MYKLLIVDDEPLITEGLSVLVNWEQHGVGKVFTANTVDEALSIIDQTQIDILITDIRMPRKDGLFLLKCVQNKQDIEKIVISGYDDFKYAQNAIKFGVSDYILKPIDEQKLINVVGKSIEKLNKKDKERQAKSNIELLQILNFKQNIENTSSNIREIKNHYFQALWTESENNDNEKKSYYFFHYLHEIQYKNTRRMVVINDPDRAGVLQKVSLFTKELPVKTRVVLGPPLKGIGALSTFYKKFKYAHYFFDLDCYRGHENILFQEDVSNLDACYSELIRYQDKMLLLERVDHEKQREIINNFGRIVRSQARSSYDLFMSYLFLYRMFLSRHNFLTMYELDNESFLYEFYVEMLQQSSLNGIEEVLVRKISSSQIQKVYHPTIDRILREVSYRYCENLTLQKLADEFNMNAAYLGRLFSKEMKMSFSDYLSDYRLKQAYNFLLTTRRTTSDIARIVGFNDSSYFYKKFKEKYQMTPSELREMKKNG